MTWKNRARLQEKFVLLKRVLVKSVDRKHSSITSAPVIFDKILFRWIFFPQVMFIKLRLCCFHADLLEAVILRDIEARSRISAQELCDRQTDLYLCCPRLWLKSHANFVCVRVCVECVCLRACVLSVSSPVCPAARSVLCRAKEDFILLRLDCCLFFCLCISGAACLHVTVAVGLCWRKF